MTKSRHTQQPPPPAEPRPGDEGPPESAGRPGAAPESAPAAPAPEEAAAADSPERQAEGPAGKVDQSLESLQMQVVRLMADYDNYRKRVIREKTEIFEQANSELISRLLPVLDNAMLGAEAGEKHHASKSVLEGFRMIIRQFSDVLADFGLVRVETVGKPFDPLTAEAVGVLPSETAPEGEVLVEIRRGYLLKNRLLRAARVIVSSCPAQAPAPAKPKAGG